MSFLIMSFLIYMSNPYKGDLNSDGTVNSDDLTTLINNWYNPYTWTDLNNILAF